jgi:hypothetical protein
MPEGESEDDGVSLEKRAGWRGGGIYVYTLAWAALSAVAESMAAIAPGASPARVRG